MPYIKSNERTKFNELTNNYKKVVVGMTAGQLNYLITTLIKEYFNSNGSNYQAINNIVGALESCKAEFQRRIVGPYEDLKIHDNGDVY